MVRTRLALPSGIAALVCFAVACSGSGSKRLQGTWKGLRAEGVATNAVATANAFATSMQLDIRGDAITVQTPKDRQAGHYKVVKEDKASVVITTDKDGPSQPQTFTFVDDKTMRWAVVDGQAIVFARQ
jgi:hypothetical protein